MLEVAGLDGRVAHQQAEQMANRFVGRFQVQLHILFDALEQFFTAGKDDAGGLLVIEKAQHHAGQQKQAGEHHADMHMERKSAFIERQRAWHCSSLQGARDAQLNV